MSGPAIRSLLFGKLAVSTRFITEQQLQECLDEQKELGSQGETVPLLGELLERKGFLTRSQLKIVLESMAKIQKRRFGEIALAFQFVTEAQVSAAVEVQGLLEKASEPGDTPLKDAALEAYKGFHANRQLGGNRPKIGEVLAAMGAMKPHQVSAVMEEQSKVIETCGGCDASLNISGFAPGQKIRCAQCGSVLTVAKTEGGRLELQMPPMTGMFRSPVQAPEAPAVEPPAPPPQQQVPMPTASDKISMIGARLPGVDTAGPLPTQFGDFKLLKLLGEDTISRVFRAEQSSRNRVVALKIMRRSAMLDDDFREQFLASARKAASLEHPNVRRIFSVSRIDDRYCVAMEYLESDSVYALLQKNGKFGHAEAVRLIRPVLEALAAAHKAGIVHGDVRPSMLMITKEGTVKLADLGLAAKATDSVLKVSESGRVAPFYIAPECVTGDRAADQRIDIYSAGATLFHMITGKPPFEGKNPFEVLMKISTDSLPSLKAYDPTAPEGLNALIHKMIDPEPDSRYATCEQVLADLDRAATAGPAGAPGSAPVAAAGGRPLVPVLVAAAVLVVAALGWRSWKTSERVTAFEAVKLRAGGARQSPAEYAAARADLKHFAEAWPGTAEAESAGREIAALTDRERQTATKELADAEREANALLASGKLGKALSRINSVIFSPEGEPRIDVLRKKIEDEGAKSWAPIEAAAIKLAEEGKSGEAEEKIASAVEARALGSDLARATSTREQVQTIRTRREAQARVEAAERERREAEERRLKEEAAAKQRWESLLADFDAALSGFDVLAALKVLERPDAAVPERREARERMEKIAMRLSDLKQSAAASIANTQAGWDGKVEGDKRIRAALKGGDGRASAANETEITFSLPGGTTQKVAWNELDTRVAAEALLRGAEGPRKFEFRLTLAYWCAARSAGSDPATDRWLLDEAERRVADAPDLKEEAAPLEARLAAWAERAQKDAFDRIGALVAESKFAEALQQNRTVRNAFGRRRSTQDRAAELDALAKTALAAGAAPEKFAWEDFTQGTGALEVTGGWKAAGGTLTGNGKEEKITVAAPGLEEVGFLVRFAKPEFRVSIVAGESEVRLEPSRPRFDVLVRREGASPIQKTMKEKPEEIRAGTWHLLQLKFTGTDLVVTLDGEEQGTVAAGPNPGEFVLTLSGVSQTQPGAVELDCLMVKRK